MTAPIGESAATANMAATAARPSLLEASTSAAPRVDRSASLIVLGHEGPAERRSYGSALASPRCDGSTW